MSKWNSFIVGILAAIAAPVIAYGIVSLLIELLMSVDVLDRRFLSSDFYSRTLPLIALCTNALTMQYFYKRRWDHAMRGMILPTILLAGLWIYFNQGVLDAIGF